MARSRQRKKSRGGFKYILLLAFILLMMVILANNVLVKYMLYDEAKDPGNTDVIAVNIPSGASTERIANILHDNGIIDDVKAFKLKSRFNKLDGTFQAGDYHFSPSMTTSEIMKALQSGHYETARFTIPEGYNIRQTAAKLQELGFISDVQEFYDACEDEYDYEFFGWLDGSQKDPTGTLSAKANRLEGFLFPDTYEVFVGATPHQIIDKMLGQFEKKWQEVGGFDTDSGLSIQELVTIASLIEKEAKVDSERPLVSSVIYNRLDIDMKLQFCSSVIYSLGQWKSRLLYSDLEVDSPYNTYKYSDLPPGPIASPGKASLDAALNPANTDYLYFVLKGNGTGEHNFAKDYSSFANYKQDYLNTQAD
ncbi:MAG: endolytic transglycosylase MltG [Clostridia bacterium]|nr:endolytic transglycosylase MltG [Clostridia bacterium]